MAGVPSIVVFSRGRAEFLRRLGRFHAGYPGQLIIVDGSERPVRGISLPVHGEYLHRPGMSVHGRIAEGMDRVRSTSCALSADDDYQLHAGLLACGRAIESDPSLSCAAGTVAYFVSGSSSPGRAIADAAVERILELPDASDALARFRAFVFLGPQVLYACFRTSVVRRVARAFEDLPDEDGLVGEQLWGALPALFGRTQFLHRLQLCRRRAARDYSGYLAPFRALDDISDWRSFDRYATRIRALAMEAGADEAGADAVIETWREFAAETSRGRSSWKSRRFPAAVRVRRVLRNVLSAVGVVASPHAWMDPVARGITRNAAVRPLLRSRAYPWADVSARQEFLLAMSFDSRTGDPGSAPS